MGDLQMSRRFVVVGCGARAKIGRHIPDLEPQSSVAWIVDTEEIGRQRGRALFEDEVTAFDSTASFLAYVAREGISVAGAIVTTPDNTHAEVASAFIHAGIPVYLEKPMSITLEDSDYLLSVAQQTGTRLYVGHNMRHMAVVRLMKQIIDDGLIGTVQAIWCRHFVGHGGDYYFKDWHAQQSHAGTLLLQKGAHDIDVIHYLAGSSTAVVQGMGDLLIYGDNPSRRDNSDLTMPQWFNMDHWPPREVKDLNPIIDVEDLSMIQMRLENGAFASYQQCHFTPDYWRNYTVIGDAGRLENFGDSNGGVVRVWNQRHDYSPHGDLEFPITGDVDGHDDADRLTMAEFLAYIDGQDDIVTSARAARDAVATAVLGAYSLRNGSRPMRIPQPEQTS